jgi:hypothetical protein
MPDFEKMSKNELEKKLKELKELHEEVIEEKKIVLGQSNLHIPGGTVIKYENEINNIKEDIATVERLLQE